MTNRLSALLLTFTLAFMATPAHCQKVSALPAADPISGSERISASQGSGCSSGASPCKTVAVTPVQISTYLSGTFQPLDSDLSAIANGPATTATGRDLLTAADAAAIRFKAGLGTMATQNSSGVSITGGTIAGLSSPLPVASGGTGDSGTAWTAYTPTVSSSTGTLTSASATGRYKQVGKMACVAIHVSITTNGSANGGIIATLPFPAASTSTSDAQIFAGRETAAVGSALTGTIRSGSSQIEIQRYDNASPGGNGYVLQVSGCYETQ